MKFISHTIYILTISIFLISCTNNKPTNKKEMIIYSVTTKVDNNILNEWLSWVDGHIEHVLETNRFSKAIFTKVNGLDDTSGPTYNIQFYAHSMESLEQYRKVDAPSIKKGTLEKFPTGLTNSRAEYTFIKEFNNN